MQEKLTVTIVVVVRLSKLLLSRLLLFLPAVSLEMIRKDQMLTDHLCDYQRSLFVGAVPHIMLITHINAWSSSTQCNVHSSCALVGFDYFS